MELRARTRPLLRRAGLLAALTALLVPAVAGTSQRQDPAPCHEDHPQARATSARR